MKIQLGFKKKLIGYENTKYIRVIYFLGFVIYIAKKEWYQLKKDLDKSNKKWWEEFNKN